MKKVIWIIAIVLIVVAGAFLFLAMGKTKVPANCQSNLSGNVAILYTQDKKFLPPCVQINSGNKITWINNSSEKLEIGADPHPIHTGNKELSGGNFVLSIDPAKSSTVTLNKKGTFGFHNHLQPAAKGVVVVK